MNWKCEVKNIINNDLFAREIQHEHSRLVSRISGLLAKKAQFTNDEAMLIESAAITHDVGKRFVPKEILLKSSKLTKHEYKIIQSHVFYGAEYILQTMSNAQTAHCTPFRRIGLI